MSDQANVGKGSIKRREVEVGTKEIIKIRSSNVFHIIAEPGDATRYDFYLINLASVVYCVDPRDTMRYPGIIYGYYMTIPTTTVRDFCENMHNLAARLQVNVNTLNQVLIAVRECYPKFR